MGVVCTTWWSYWAVIDISLEWKMMRYKPHPDTFIRISHLFSRVFVWCCQYSFHDINPGERPYSCHTCSRTFSRKHHLLEHQNLHAGNVEMSLPCSNVKLLWIKWIEVTSNQFLRLVVQRRYIFLFFTGLKPFRCKCNRAFSHSSTFSHHKKTCETWSGLAKKNNHAAEKQ